MGGMGLAKFGTYPRYGDYRHIITPPTTDRGRGLVIQTSENEFYICGVNITLTFRKNPPLTTDLVPQQQYQEEHYMDYLRVEEGSFDSEGNWKATRIRNGDQTDFGIYVYPDSGAVRIILE